MLPYHVDSWAFRLIELMLLASNSRSLIPMSESGVSPAATRSAWSAQPQPCRRFGPPVSATTTSWFFSAFITDGVALNETIFTLPCAPAEWTPGSAKMTMPSKSGTMYWTSGWDLMYEAVFVWSVFHCELGTFITSVLQSGQTRFSSLRKASFSGPVMCGRSEVLMKRMFALPPELTVTKSASALPGHENEWVANAFTADG